MSASIMKAERSEPHGEWDELPTDGRQAWVGMLMVAGSGLVSLRVLGWLATTICGVVMQ